jgi:hypothetical protein
MSFEYHVAVHKENWPTASALQAYLNENKYPVKLAEVYDRPFQIEAGWLSLDFYDRAISLEASTVQLSPTKFFAYSFDRPPDATNTDADGVSIETYKFRPDEVMKGEDINASLAKIGATDVSFGDGDYVLTLSFRSSTDELRAGMFVMAALIKCFGGYAFEFQEGNHGSGDLADELAEQAADEKLWIRTASH